MRYVEAYYEDRDGKPHKTREAAQEADAVIQARELLRGVLDHVKTEKGYYTNGYGKYGGPYEDEVNELRAMWLRDTAAANAAMPHPKWTGPRPL